MSPDTLQYLGAENCHYSTFYLSFCASLISLDFPNEYHKKYTHPYFDPKLLQATSKLDGSFISKLMKEKADFHFNF